MSVEGKKDYISRDEKINFSDVARRKISGFFHSDTATYRSGAFNDDGDY
jgi:hypothetical protein